MNRQTDSFIVDKSRGRKAGGEDEGIVSPGSYKEEQDGCGGPQEQLINGCSDVVKGKVAAWSEGETDENGCRRSPKDHSPPELTL